MGAYEELDTDEPLKKRIERHAYDRLIMLSDGVFAIAVTLAALDIKPPAAWGSLPDLIDKLHYPVLAYLVSFAVVASYWGSQRELLSRLIRIDGPVTLMALAQLLCIALIPSATQLLTHKGPDAPAVAVYGGLLAVCGYLAAGMWAYAALHPRLLHPEGRTPFVWGRVAVALIVPGVFTWIAVTNGSLTTAPIISLVALGLGRRLVIARFPEAKALMSREHA